MSVSRRFRYAISPLEAYVLIKHVLESEDAENDAEHTVEELAAEIDTFDGYVSKGILESALYCCNMESERGAFFHPMHTTPNFDRFVKDLLPLDQEFDKYYNVIKDKKV